MSNKELLKKEVVAKGTPVGDRTIRFIISDETVDRVGDVIMADGWDFTDYAKNAVFLGFHDYSSFPLGVGKAWGIDSPKKQAWLDVYFPTIEEMSTNPEMAAEAAKNVDFTYNAYKIGLLNAVSVGFTPTEYTKMENPDQPEWMWGNKFIKQSLLEVSAVPVPCNPNALAAARTAKAFDPKFLDLLEARKMLNTEKGVLPYKKYPLADEGTSWDAGQVVKDSSTDDLKKICAWVDSDAEDVKTSYKLPHHLTADDGYKTVWRGVSAAMAALLGARGGAAIPEADREGVYNHLAKHYKEFDKDVPEFKKYEEVELKAIFPEFFGVPKAGARLSQASKDSLAAIHKSLTDVHKSMSDVMDSLKDFMAGGDTEVTDEDENIDKKDLAKLTISQVAELLR